MRSFNCSVFLAKKSIKKSKNARNDLFRQMLDLITMEDFKSLISVLNYYHGGSRKRAICGSCLFLSGNFFIFEELRLVGSTDVTRLRYYCILREKRICYYKTPTRLQANIERRRLQPEKNFNKFLSKWNGTVETMPSPSYVVNSSLCFFVIFRLRKFKKCNLNFHKKLLISWSYLTF